MLPVIYTHSHISWAKWMGLILWTDPHCLMWKVMTCGCSNSQHTDHSVSNGTHRHWNPIRTSSFTRDCRDSSSPLSLMDAHCTLALPQITFIWIIHHGDCSIIVALLSLLFAFQRCCDLCFTFAGFHFKSQKHKKAMNIHIIYHKMCFENVFALSPKSLNLEDICCALNFWKTVNKNPTSNSFWGGGGGVIQNKNNRNHTNCSSHFNLLCNHGSHISLFRVANGSSHARWCWVSLMEDLVLKWVQVCVGKYRLGLGW